MGNTVLKYKLREKLRTHGKYLVSVFVALGLWAAAVAILTTGTYAEELYPILPAGVDGEVYIQQPADIDHEEEIEPIDLEELVPSVVEVYLIHLPQGFQGIDFGTQGVHYKTVRGYTADDFIDGEDEDNEIAEKILLDLELSVLAQPGYRIGGWVAFTLDEYGAPNFNNTASVIPMTEPGEAMPYYTAIVPAQGELAVFVVFEPEIFFWGAFPEEYPEETYPAEAYPAQEYPTEEYPAEAYPAQEYPAEEYPTEEYPTEEYPAEEALSEEAPAEEYIAEEYLPEESPAQQQIVPLGGIPIMPFNTTTINTVVNANQTVAVGNTLEIVSGGVVNGNITVNAGGTLVITGTGTVNGSVTLLAATVGNPSTFNMNGGTVTGAGFGVALHAFTTFNMSGGSIQGNNIAVTQTTAQGGAGVQVNANATFNMSGTAVIEQNTITVTSGASGNLDGAGVRMVGGTTAAAQARMYMSGSAEIRHNSITSSGSRMSSGAGVHVQSNAYLAMSGNASIHNNTITQPGTGGLQQGAGVRLFGGTTLIPRASLFMEGNAEIRDNHINITGTMAVTGNGGGVQLNNASYLRMSGNAAIHGNRITSTGTGVLSGGGVQAIGNGTNLTGIGTTQPPPWIHMGGNATIRDNQVFGQRTVNGGGVHLDQRSRLYMRDDSSIAHNTARVEVGTIVLPVTVEAFGGGIATSGIAAVVLWDNFRIYENLAIVSQLTPGNNSLARGGGISLRPADLFTIHGGGGEITNNRVVRGVLNDAGDIVASADDSNNIIGGGGIYTHRGFTMNGGLIAHNHVFGTGGGYQGGGVFLNAPESQSSQLANRTIHLRNDSLIYDNHSHGWGGGLRVHGGQLRMHNEALVYGNTALHQGGGVHITDGPFRPATSGGFFLYANLVLEPSLQNSFGIINNHVLEAADDATAPGSSDTIDGGGGIWARVGGFAFPDNLVFGGGWFDEGWFNITLPSTTLRDGGVYIHGGTVEENTVTRTDGTGTGVSGGGGVLIHAGTYMQTGGRIQENVVSTDPAAAGLGIGGGLWMMHTPFEMSPDQLQNFVVPIIRNTSGLMTSGVIRDNEAEDHGGGVAIQGDLTFLTRERLPGDQGAPQIGDPGFGQVPPPPAIRNNEALAGHGGGVYVRGGDTILDMRFGTIFNNFAEIHGGGVFLRPGGTVNMSGGTIEANEALTGDGGGVYVQNTQNGAFTMTAGSILHNRALDGDGGGIFTVNYLYEPVLTSGAPGVYNNLLISSGTIFGGNLAQDWSFPPDVVGGANNQLLNVLWDPATGSSRHAGGFLYLLNNDDINYRQADPLFGFIKHDDDGDPLVGAQFRLYRYDNGAWVPHANDDGETLVLSAATDGWVGDWEISRDGQYRLVEVQAPTGFQTPGDHWEISRHPVTRLVRIYAIGVNPDFGGPVGGVRHVKNEPIGPDVPVILYKWSSVLQGGRDNVTFWLDRQVWCDNEGDYVWDIGVAGPMVTTSPDYRINLSLSRGNTYRLRETIVPPGYQLPENGWSWIFTVAQNGSVSVTPVGAAPALGTSVPVFPTSAVAPAEAALPPISIQIPEWAVGIAPFSTPTGYYVFERRDHTRAYANAASPVNPPGRLNRIPVYAGNRGPGPGYPAFHFALHIPAPAILVGPGSTQNGPGSITEAYVFDTIYNQFRTVTERAPGHPAPPFAYPHYAALWAQGAVGGCPYCMEPGCLADPNTVDASGTPIVRGELFRLWHGNTQGHSAPPTGWGDRMYVEIRRNNTSPFPAAGDPVPRWSNVGLRGSPLFQYAYVQHLQFNRNEHPASVVYNPQFVPAYGPGFHNLDRYGRWSRHVIIGNTYQRVINFEPEIYASAPSGRTGENFRVNCGANVTENMGWFPRPPQMPGLSQTAIVHPGPNADRYTFGGWFDSRERANNHGSQVGRVLHTDVVTSAPIRTLYARWYSDPVFHLVNDPYPDAELEFIKKRGLEACDPDIPDMRETLDGAQFHLWRRVWAANNTYTWAQILDNGQPLVLTSGPNGVVLTDLPHWYLDLHRNQPQFMLREIQAPQGFRTPPGHWLIRVNFNYTTQEASLVFQTVLHQDEDVNNPNTPDFRECEEGVWHLGNSPLVRFRFHKTDHRLYSQVSQDPNNPTCWDTVHTFLLEDAHFAMYRFNGPGTPPNQVITQAQIGTGPGQWTRIEDWISSATPTTPEDYMWVYLDPVHTYFQLAETQAPPGFDLPFGQWRLTLRATPMTNPPSHLMDHGYHLQIRYIGDSTIPAFARNQDGCDCDPCTCDPCTCPHPQYGVFYVGNRPVLVLPLLGGDLMRSTFLLGGLLVILMGLGLLTYRIRRGKSAPGR